MSAETKATPKILDFIYENAPEGFKDETTKFSILCEKEPYVGTFSIKAKALYIIFKNKDDDTTKLYPDNIKQPYFEFKESNRRRLLTKKKPFWINGDMKIETYNEYTYINYSFNQLKKSEESMMKKFRIKYSVEEPEVYEGENLGFIFE